MEVNYDQNLPQFDDWRENVRCMEHGPGKVLATLTAPLQYPHKISLTFEYVWFPTLPDAMIQTALLLSNNFCYAEEGWETLLRKEKLILASFQEIEFMHGLPHQFQAFSN